MRMCALASDTAGRGRGPRRGYHAHFVGKWHLGMASRAQIPVGRGFNSSLGYFHSQNDCAHMRIHRHCTPYDACAGRGPFLSQTLPRLSHDETRSRSLRIQRQSRCGASSGNLSSLAESFEAILDPV